MISLSRKEARLFLLKHQHLYNPRKIEGDESILQFIEKIGCIQYDPLNKVGRNADLVLQSRCKNYTESVLYDLLYTKRKLLDEWDKCMAIVSVSDWPYFERNRKVYKSRYHKRRKELNGIRKQIQTKIKETGALNSSDIKSDVKVDWSWAPTDIGRATLESMYQYGELIVHHKKGTRKYYDFTRDHIPEAILNMPDPNSTKNDFYEWYTKRRIGSVGMMWNKAGDAWLGIKDFKKDQRDRAFKKLIAEGHVEELNIEEAYMKSLGFPEAGRHIQEHVEFMTSLKQLQDKIGRDSDMEFSIKMKNWFIEHIQKADKVLGIYLLENGEK